VPLLNIYVFIKETHKIWPIRSRLYFFGGLGRLFLAVLMPLVGNGFVISFYP
jgi:hypothetical protein